MYPDIKSNAIGENEAIAIVGQKNIDAVKKINCQPTNRVIDDCYNVTEFSASIDCEDVDGNDVTLTILYLEDTDNVNSVDDLGSLSWDNYTFTIV